MGSITQMLKDASGATADEQAQKERLEMLLKLAKTKIQTYRDKIEMNFSNPGTIDKIQIPGIRAMRYIEQYHVASKQGLDEKVQDHMTAAIDAFFSIGGDGSTKKAVQDGVKSLISTALSGFIGSTEVGESEQIIFVVVPENNAFIRADIACWKYHFEQHKFIDQSDTAIAYVLCKSVVDHTKITLDELIYLATDAMAKRTAITYEELTEADKTTISTAVTAAKKSASAAKAAKPNTGLPTLAGNYTKISLDFGWVEDAADKTKGWWVPTAIDKTGSNLLDGYHSTSTVPSITDVEAYIDELIKVWKKLKDERA